MNSCPMVWLKKMPPFSIRCMPSVYLIQRDQSVLGFSLGESKSGLDHRDRKMKTERLKVNKRVIFSRKDKVGFSLIILLCLVLCTAGCTRKRYREKADEDVYGLLNTANQCDPLWDMNGYSLEESGTSRYANLYDDDKQPMPQDDATAHRLMQCVDGKKGSRKWNKNGVVDHVDNDAWIQSLPAPLDGKIIIDQKVAFDLAILHSPEYRTAMENVYLSALSVTGERYAFDVQFFGTESLLYNNHGMFRKDATAVLTNNINVGGGNSAGATKAFAAGGQFSVELLNSLVWTFTPESGFTPSTTLSYSFTQPFLRGAGRMIVLENLTRSERRLLANVRQLLFYQQGFYVRVLSGGSPVSAPSSSGYPNSGVNASGLGGFYGLLSSQVQIRNQQQNVASLQNNLNRYEELFNAGQVKSRTDVDRVRQSLLSGQSNLLSKKDSYEESVDSYFVNILGLPPGIENIVIQDPLLNQFDLMPTILANAQEHLDKFLMTLRDIQKKVPDNISEFYASLKDQVENGEKETLADIEKLQQDILPNRMKAFSALEVQLKENPEIDASYFTPAMLEKRIKNIRGDFDRNVRELDDYGNEKVKGIQWIFNDLFCLMQETFLKYDRPTLTKMIRQTLANPGASPFSPEVVRLIYELKLEGELVDENDDSDDSDNSAGTAISGQSSSTGDQINETDRKLKDLVGKNVIPPSLNDPWRDWLHTLLTRFSDELMTLRLLQARARLESLQLTVVDISSEEAFQVAAEYRLDWMNERSALVDTWRNIEIVADKLKSGLDVSVGSDFRNEGLNPLNFSAKNSTFKASMYFDAPLDRLLERNLYRQALITYDQARRSYYRYIDTVHLQIRSMVRSIRLAQEDFELSRENVLTAIERVHQSQLALTQPPSGSTRIGSISSTAAMDLVDALDNLLTYQNSFMQSWLNYRTKKMTLLLMLGLFEIDQNGRWIDPGDIDRAYLSNKMIGIYNSQDNLAGLPKLPQLNDLTGGQSLEEVMKTPAVDAERNGNANAQSGSSHTERSAENRTLSTENSTANAAENLNRESDSYRTRAARSVTAAKPPVEFRSSRSTASQNAADSGEVHSDETALAPESEKRSGSIL